MQLYSDGNPTPFFRAVVKEVVPIWDHAQGESEAIFSGLEITFTDGRTKMFIDVAEADRIYQVMAYR